jgi:hypothetical protein
MVPSQPKAGPARKVGVLKIARPKAKPRPRGTLEIELALTKPIRASNKFRLLDVAASSHAHATDAAASHTARVPAFDNLSEDSSLDVRKTPSPERVTEKCVSPPPSASGEFLCFSFTIFIVGLDNSFCRSYPSCALARFSAGEPK